ncbi:Plasmodium exported protein (hyp11), unknown function [Plasmodium sp. gorilla clade G3]|nr:Plasmodium exported protein (hyp11), unknown function [Plasmodium sp. gorilla clade G3]
MNKSYTFINVIILFLTILLFFTYCDEYYNYDTFSKTKCNNNIKINISRFKRIIAEASEEEKYPWEEDFCVILSEEELIRPKKNDSPYLLEYYENIDKINELSMNSTKIWKETIKKIRQNYEKETNNMNHNWRDFMWHYKWANIYLHKVHKLINITLKDLTNPIHDKEETITNWIKWIQEDVEYFMFNLQVEWLRILTLELYYQIKV